MATVRLASTDALTKRTLAGAALSPPLCDPHATSSTPSDRLDKHFTRLIKATPRKGTGPASGEARGSLRRCVGRMRRNCGQHVTLDAKPPGSRDRSTVL